MASGSAPTSCCPPAMPAAVLAVLLFAATVDPRLAEPLRLLAEVGARDAGTVGAFYARVPNALSLWLVVRPLPDGELSTLGRSARPAAAASAPSKATRAAAR